jgi:ABC-type sugar transport system ATPase subunit
MMCGIHKSFPGVQALENVDFDLRAGEVHALLGENGAGKSTLIKILGGAHQPDAGKIFIASNDIDIHSPGDALRAGIAAIYQEFNLVPTLSARENIFLGQESTTLGFIRRREELHQAKALLNRVGVEIDPDIPCNQLSIAQQQVVEIAKALSLAAKIIIMDEPSATLTPQEVEFLFEVIRDLQQQGIGIIYISHRLPEIFQIADRVTILRDGQHVATKDTAEVTRDTLIEMMVGRRLEHEFPHRDMTPGETRLAVTNLCRGNAVRGVSLSVGKGEVLGITGLVGAGRTEMARLIFAADKPTEGEIFLDGQRLKINTPRDAIRAGICLLTEDRKFQGLILKHSVLENFGLPNLDHFARLAFVNQGQEQESLDKFVKRLRIKLTSSRQLAANLSGGNQQKVVLAKWLERNCEVVIFDEPTRGIDVGAKYEIYQLMNALAVAGKAIIMISSELPEILGMSDRILVMHEGRVTGEITDVENATQEQIMHLAVA